MHTVQNYNISKTKQVYKCGKQRTAILRTLLKMQDNVMASVSFTSQLPLVYITH